MARLASPIANIQAYYPIVVVGSGYGGGIAASRLARAGQKVCVLEQGKEFQPGEYPDNAERGLPEIQVSAPGTQLGSRSGLYHIRIFNDINVFSGCGLGGTSLVNANVALEAEPRVFDDPDWPEALRQDVNTRLAEGYGRAQEMLKPTPLPPDSPPLPKLQALEKSAAYLKQKFYRPPINVNFKDEINHVGVPQKACNYCGDCISGCNVGAKNTVLMNYLPDAKFWGAEIFTQVAVRHLEQRNGRWSVHYQVLNSGEEQFDAPLEFVEADIVILAGGTLGSTEILLRTREKGLALSDQLGQHFSGNGDVLAFAHQTQDKINGIGFGDRNPTRLDPVGPCITGIIDIRNQPNLNDGMVIEEGSIPGALAPFMPGMLAAAAELGRSTSDNVPAPIPLPTTNSGSSNSASTPATLNSGSPHHAAGTLTQNPEIHLPNLLDGLAGVAKDGLDRVQTYLVMSHDDDEGKLSLENDFLRLDWPGVGELPLFKKIDEVLRAATVPIGGTFLDDPIWCKTLNYHLVTVHPLGGCVMGEEAGRGVVNHKGQVFQGTAGTAVYKGLYVSDGSIVPCTLGVNPLLTISALAERNVALLAEDYGWQINYSLTNEPPMARLTAPIKIGLEFTETMRGFFSTKVKDEDYARGESLGKTDKSGLEFTLTIASDDLDLMLSDPQHEARLAGTVSAPVLAQEALQVSDGYFNLFVQDPAQPKTRRMLYRMRLDSEQGQTYYFEGFKLVQDDTVFNMWRDTTTLYVTLYKGENEHGAILGRGILKIEAPDFIKQLTTMKITNAPDLVKEAEALARFNSFFAGALLDTYGLGVPILFKDALTPTNIPAYTLDGVKNAEITTHYFSTADKLGLSMLRFKRAECQDVVVLIHGLTTSTDMFIMPEHYNLVNYLLDNGFTDVWGLDFRMSNRHSYNMTSHRYSMDDVALYDYPAAFARLREEVGNRRIHVICHCLGSVTFMMSLFGKAIDGITSVISNSVSLTPRVPFWSGIKLRVMPSLVENVLGLPYVSPAWEDDRGVTRGKMISRLISLFHQECEVPSCHMLSAMWGTGWPALYNHANLSELTHRRGDVLYGATSMNYYRHVLKMVKATGQAVKFYPQDARFSALPDNYWQYAKDITTPVLFITGMENRVFADSNYRTYMRLQKLVPGRHEFEAFPGYGHQDVFMGQNNYLETFPRLLEFLRKHSQ